MVGTITVCLMVVEWSSNVNDDDKYVCKNYDKNADDKDNDDDEDDDDEGGGVVPLLTWAASGAPSLQIRHSPILLETS